MTTFKATTEGSDKLGLRAVSIRQRPVAGDHYTEQQRAEMFKR